MRPTSAAFVDVLFVLLLTLAIALWLLIKHVNPPEESGAPPPGQLAVEISWPADVNVDVDLWVKAPGEIPVGYSNKSGHTWNLLRDDLGHTGDSGHGNWENAYSRGMPDGEYVVNLHLYKHHTGGYPIPVTVKVWAQVRGKKIPIHESSEGLYREGQELTVIAFRILAGQILPGSFHNTPIPLRAQ